MGDFFGNYKSAAESSALETNISVPLIENSVSFVGVVSDIKSKITKTQQLRKDRKRNEDDIYTIDQNIRRIINNGEKRMEEIRKRKKQLQWICNNSRNTLEIKEAKQQLFEITKEMDRIDTIDIAEYEAQTKELINRYEHILTQPIVQSFVSSMSDPQILNTASISREKLLIYRDFIGIARNYIKLDVGINRELEMVCPTCHKSDFEYKDDTIVCKVCSIEMEIVDDTSSYRDVTRVNLTNRFSYSRNNHFSDAVERFQAKQNKTIPPEIYNSLSNHIKRCGLTNDTVTLDHIYIFLGEDGYTNYYDDLRLIYHKQTNKLPMDISHLESQLMDDHEKLNKILPEVLDDLKIHRLTALNVDYELIKHLEHRGFEFQKDMYIFKTRKTAVDHDEICQECFKRLGWEFKPTV